MSSLGEQSFWWFYLEAAQLFISPETAKFKSQSVKDSNHLVFRVTKLAYFYHHYGLFLQIIVLIKLNSSISLSIFDKIIQLKLIWALSVDVKVLSNSLSSCKNLLHTAFRSVQLFCSYSKTSCMKHWQFSIKICHYSCIYCNSVCPGDSKLREPSPNHSVSSPLWFHWLWSGQMWDKKLFLLQVRWGGFSWEYPVFTPPNQLALSEMREMILKGRKPNITRNK